MALPWDELILPLIVAYLAYIVWTRQDGRYPIVLALILLLASAVADAAGDLSAANTLAVFVFYFLVGGVVVLLIEHLREGRRVPATARVPRDGSDPENSPPGLGGDAPDEPGGDSPVTPGADPTAGSGAG